MDYYQGILEQAFREDQGDYSAQPKKDDAVLGGNNPPTPTDAAVLGTGKLFGRLFDQFNNEAKLINGHYMRLQPTPEVALIRSRRALPLSDIKIKVLVATTTSSEDFKAQYWQFAGYLKHDGQLFGHTAKYDPARCEKELRAIVYKALTQ